MIAENKEANEKKCIEKKERRARRYSDAAAKRDSNFMVFIHSKKLFLKISIGQY